GRTGRLFACNHWNMEPDILVLAKALGGGMPLGAFIGRSSVMATLSQDPPLAHVTTFGGHPVCCAAGLAALEILVALNLPERAARIGEQWTARLREMIGGPLVAVRGIGLLIGLELSDAERARRFASRCLDEGLILNWTLHRDTVIRLAPPLVIEDDEIAHSTEIMRRLLEEL